MTDGADPETLTREDGVVIAYHHSPGKGTGANLPGVVFLGGFMSDMSGTKALRLEAFCRSRGQQFTRLDYRGHGVSGGRFSDGTVGLWAGDALAVIDLATNGPQILVGSSMGGWIMLLAALARPDRVTGLVGIAPAPDFVMRMEAELTPEQKHDIETQGYTGRPSAYSDEPYTITAGLLKDGRQHLLLDKPEIPLDLPARLLHGLEDEAVPWETSLELARKLRSHDVRITYVKDGDHRLSADPDLALLESTVGELTTTLTCGSENRV